MQLAFEQEYYRIQEIVKKNNKRAIKGNGLQALLKDIVDSNVSLNYSTKRSYLPGCVAVYDGDFYVCNTSTTGVWVPANWTVINWSLWHPYTEDYENRLITAGDTLDGTRKTYIDDFFVAITPHLSNIVRMNMFLSDTFTGFNVPMILSTSIGSPVIGDLYETNGGFVSGDWSVAGGLTGDGATKFLDTGIDPSAVFSQDDMCIATWIKTINNGRIVIGSRTGSNVIQLSYAFSGYTNAVLGNINDDYGSNSYAAQTAGFLALSRTASTGHELYKNGASVGTFAIASTGIPTDNVDIFRRTDGNYSSDTMYGYMLANGLDASAILDIYNAWNTLNTNVGR